MRATRLFVRRAAADRYFNRVPSLPATDDGSARPLAEDLSTGSGDGEEISGDADTAGMDEAPAATGSDAGPVPADTAPTENGAAAGPGDNGADAGQDLADTPGLGARLQAVGLGTADRTGTDAAARRNGNGDVARVSANGDAAGEAAGTGAGESGRWFRPAAATNRHATVQPDEQGDRAGAGTRARR